jgi:hypothetical protein
MRSRRLVGWVGAALAALVCSAPPGASQACINGVELAVDPRVAMVARAETDAAEGRYLDALKNVAMTLPGKPPEKPTPLQERALLVTARAIARTNGRIGWGGKEASGEAAVAENLALAVRIVEERVKREPQNGTLRTDLGEVLSRVPARQAEARALLGDLERRRLVASAHGYAALVRLRDAAGADAPGWTGPVLAAMNKAPRALAMSRCLAMAKEKSICDASTSRLASSR